MQFSVRDYEHDVLKGNRLLCRRVEEAPEVFDALQDKPTMYKWIFFPRKKGEERKEINLNLARFKIFLFFFPSLGFSSWNTFLVFSISFFSLSLSFLLQLLICCVGFL
jgi:hypothetical protein